MQQQIDTRSSMREKVRSLTKFQMLRLISRREAHKTQDRLEMRADSPNPLEPSEFDPLIDWGMHQILGLQGYRTTGTHTGLDPIESVCEMAFEIGKFIRLLATGQLHTHNLFYLIGMSIAGLCLILPLIVLVAESRFSGWNDQSIWLGVLFTPLALMGFALWMNVNTNVASHTPQSMSR